MAITLLRQASASYYHYKGTSTYNITAASKHPGQHRVQPQEPTTLLRLQGLFFTSIFKSIKCLNGSLLQSTQKLTVDADNFDHREGEEGQRGHVHLDEDGRHQEDYQDDHQAARDP